MPTSRSRLSHKLTRFGVTCGSPAGGRWQRVAATAAGVSIVCDRSFKHGLSCEWKNERTTIFFALCVSLPKLSRNDVRKHSVTP